ncbi:MAG: endonuclease domain-containing protein [Parasphingopyxis sp.]|nr:DUF559 domain-containing protein [Sphingomonadales bacterium]
MKRDALPAGAVARARSLRRDATTAETMLWHALREKLPQAKFRRQVPLGRYFADFASHRHRLIVELDGGQHAERAEQDAARTRFLEGEGYRVLRFWNDAVLGNMDGVLERIDASLNLSPCGRGRTEGPGEGPAMSMAEKNPSTADCRSAPSSRFASARTPHPDPLPQGEREIETNQ